jgi:hypothetical protein
MPMACADLGDRIAAAFDGLPEKMKVRKRGLL